MDGAHHGVTAGRALDTVLGGKPSPSKKEGMTPAQMRAYLEKPDESPTDGNSAYSEGARRFGRLVLAYLDANPDHRDRPAEDDIDHPEWKRRKWEGEPPVIREGLYTLASKGLPEEERYNLGGLTGFMVGWGVNAAKYALELPPVANPAIIDVVV